MATFDSEVACNIVFDINGETVSSAQFLDTVKGFHANSTGKVNSVEDLLVVPLGSTSAVVMQIFRFTVTSGGSARDRMLVRIVKVEERGGKKVTPGAKAKAPERQVP
ncbi:hypothetical protein B0H17DRAFT_1147818 [Mycena rosella]|uniref:Uncharacterized protein n=1 Tax=Mycena rosella TaxID=1033263 RepID=A0AAD7CHI0_MYCRO|nr:hypothetical protein B0H17DRAFT_1147818 [Mycena rosella]